MNSSIAFIKSEGCAEEGLIRLSRDSGYTGGTYLLDGLSCNLSVSGTGDNRIVVASGSEGDFTHHIVIGLQLSPSFAIMDWGE